MITNFKIFENLNKNYNGIIYCYNVESKRNTLPKDLYLIYIRDKSEEYQKSININSIGGIKNDSFVISDILTELNVDVPYSDTYYITMTKNIKEFNEVPTYGFIYENDSEFCDNDIFLRKLLKYKDTSEIEIIDTKKVRINEDETCYIYSDFEIELQNKTEKFNI